METKMITIPFDIELAKKIQAKKYVGKIITRGRDYARIICFDAKGSYPLVVLTESGGVERASMHDKYGNKYLGSEKNGLDLFLEVPEWTQYKDGDMITCEYYGPNNYCKWFSILKGSVQGDEFNNLYYHSYVTCYWDSSDKIAGIAYNQTCQNLTSIRRITNEEKQKFSEKLQEKDNESAKYILKHFFNIEKVEKKPEFEPFQKVLVRDSANGVWYCELFSYISKNSHTEYPFVCMTGEYRYCIPYNEKTKYLIGTTDNWEEE